MSKVSDKLARKAERKHHSGAQAIQEAQEDAGSAPGGEESDTGVLEPVAEVSEVATEVADGAKSSE